MPTYDRQRVTTHGLTRRTLMLTGSATVLGAGLGVVVAFSAICPHQGCIVSAEPSEFECFCHGSRFASATGAVLKGPANRALDPIPVTVSGGSVVTS